MRRKRGEDRLQVYLAEHDVPCPKCGYNLRGLEGHTCPECGCGFDVQSLRVIGLEESWLRVWFADRWVAALEISSGALGIWNLLTRETGLPKSWLLCFVVIIMLESARDDIDHRWRFRLIAAAAVMVATQLALLIAVNR